jgi:hypothetical protein
MYRAARVKEGCGFVALHKDLHGAMIGTCVALSVSQGSAALLSHYFMFKIDGPLAASRWRRSLQSRKNLIQAHVSGGIYICNLNYKATSYINLLMNQNIGAHRRK